jgi:ferredoxin-NADP reductase
MNAGFIGPHLADAALPVCYLAGPPGFVKAMRTALGELGIDPDNIRTEEFSGY